MRDGRSLGTTKLRYEISVAPKWSIPSTLISQVVKSGLPANICAIAERAEEVICRLLWLLQIFFVTLQSKEANCLCNVTPEVSHTTRILTAAAHCMKHCLDATVSGTSGDQPSSWVVAAACEG